MNFIRSITAINNDIAAGRSLGAQLYVARESDGGGNPGQAGDGMAGLGVLVDEAFGEAARGVALLSDSIMAWMSCSKPITAIAVAQQWERGKLDLDEPVATYLSAFAAGGKDKITIRHLLTHTGGIRKAGYRFPQEDWDTIIAAICDTPVEDGWIVGETAGYHAGSSWFILGELVQRASSERLPDYVQRHVFAPLGMSDCYLGVPPEVFDRVADRVSPVWDMRTDEPKRQVYARRDRLTASSPGGGAVGPVNQLGAFYRALLAGGGGVVKRETVELFTARHREGAFDESFHQVIDWGLGFIRDSKRHGKLVIPYGFGAHASDETFGHGGNQTSLSFADPRNNLVVAFIFNGMPGERAHQQRSHELATAVYEDLGIQ